MRNEDTSPVSIVTGAGGAIGSAIARKLASNGHRVILADIDLEAADSVATDIGRGPVSTLAVEVDMGSVASIERLVAAADEEFGRIDNVINNAGVNLRGSLREFDPNDFDRMMEINVRGPAVLAQKAAVHWDRVKNGALVNIASRSWVAGGPVAYASSKAAIVGMTRSLARELASANVTSNAVAPGLVASAFTMGGRSSEHFDAMADRAVGSTPLGRLTEPEDVAGTVAFLCSPDAAYITGEVIHVCGGSQMPTLGGSNT